MQYELILGMVNITFCSSGKYFLAPFSSQNPRKLFWISWGFFNVQIFFLFPVTPLLKGDFPAGGLEIDTNILSFTILQKMHV